ncbi:MAG: hypothetical protein QXR73_00315 [Candidatus Micrarchaeaceae archaeon]
MQKKAQITIEFLIYMSIGISALSVSLYASSSLRNSYYSSISNAELESFANHIAQMEQYGSSEFEVFVPKSICSCRPESSWIYCNGTRFNTGESIRFSGSVCVNSGSLENLSEYYLGNGTYYIGG